VLRPGSPLSCIEGIQLTIFVELARRWVVERFFAWIGRNRRLAKNFETTIGSARDFLYAASVMLLMRRIANAS
jgi:putative transposase